MRASFRNGPVRSTYILSVAKDSIDLVTDEDKMVKIILRNRCPLDDTDLEVSVKLHPKTALMLMEDIQKTLKRINDMIEEEIEEAEA